MHGAQPGKGWKGGEDEGMREKRKDKRIICVGNRFVDSDDIGPQVYDYLARRDMPGAVSLIDGGLMGLDLLRFVEGARRVVFVDVLHGFAPPGRPVVLDRNMVLEERPTGYGHDGGLACLLRMLPAVCESDLPEIALVGAEPPIGPDVVEQLADMALSIATGERYERERNTAIDAPQPGAP
jgi:hydrogenase maturation protease